MKTNESLREALEKMVLIRNFEIRAESAYLQGKIGGFFHSYIGQEAIQTAAVMAIGINNWWITSYRCHALALLLGATPNELMAELYGKITGNAKGRGGSMHFYTDRMLGGFGIVAGQLPTASGAAFALKYKNIKDQIAVCFFGEGAVAQGVFHECLNLASLWNLPCIYVIENNGWGMGTAAERAICVNGIAAHFAPAYGIKGYTFNGMDFEACYKGFQEANQEVLKTRRPVLIECITERFKGHSISDPALYRSKDDMKEKMKRDPIEILKAVLKMDDEAFKTLDKEIKEKVVASMKFAEDSPNPDPINLEEDVYAP
jgi:pyruvate dehydrogenase E1 component alpha subunit